VEGASALAAEVREISRADYIDPGVAVLDDSLAAAVLTALIVVLVIVSLPYIFFVLEVLVIPAVFAYRIALHKAWAVEASSGSERMRWQVVGWTHAGDFGEEVGEHASPWRRRSDVAAGRRC
jgi:hypothetical protein